MASHEERGWANKAARRWIGFLFAAVIGGCGARSTGLSDSLAEVGVDDPEPPTPLLPSAPIALYVDAGQSCPEAFPVAAADLALTPVDSGQDIAVVELFYRDECTGAGGQHIIAREIDGFGRYWLGAHACYFFPVPPPEEPQYGVLRYSITAALFDLPPDLCIGFPGEPPGIQTSLTTEAIAVFATQADAEAFAASLSAGGP